MLYIIFDYDNSKNKYHLYLLPEIKNLIDDQYFKKKSNRREINNFDDDFYSKRKEGENGSYICSLIRNDSVKDFIIYYNQKNFSLSSTIPKSIFETNKFLLKKHDITLIEYAAFFGSIQIFQFLVFNHVELNDSLWYYSIHSNNAHLIHYLEELYSDSNNESNNQSLYKSYYIESVKCYHNDLAEYFLNNMDLKCDQFLYLKYYNFGFITKELINKQFFNDLCKYDYLDFVKLLIKYGEKDIKFIKDDILNLTNIRCYDY